MYCGKLFRILIGCAIVSTGLHARGQVTPGTILGVSRDVSGSLATTSMSVGGCPTLVCTTNVVTSTKCYTNCYWRWVCTTNSTGQVHCTNALVCNTRCYTNTFPQITCSNVYANPTSVSVRQQLTGGVVAHGACDELDGLFPSNAVFQASLSSTLRTNDWRGSHTGTFKILDGTNIVAYGSLTGVNGVGSHRGLEACALCNHLEGTLHGSVVQSGALRGARINASYKADLSGVTCPSAGVPQGPVTLAIDGVVVTPCPRLFHY